MANSSESGVIVMYKNIKYNSILKFVRKDKWSSSYHSKIILKY